MCQPKWLQSLKDTTLMTCLSAVTWPRHNSFDSTYTPITFAVGITSSTQAAMFLTSPWQFGVSKGQYKCIEALLIFLVPHYICRLHHILLKLLLQVADHSLGSPSIGKSESTCPKAKNYNQLEMSWHFNPNTNKNQNNFDSTSWHSLKHDHSFLLYVTTIIWQRSQLHGHFVHSAQSANYCFTQTTLCWQMNYWSFINDGCFTTTAPRNGCAQKAQTIPFVM